jgi:NAD+ synthase
MGYKFNVEKVTEGAINWIREWFEENGKGCNVVLGVSGGKDSLIVGKLCVEALGADRVIGVMMPCGVQKDISDSIRVCDYLGIKNYTINIEGAVNATLKQMEDAGIEISNQTIVNLPPRIRMSTLYAVSQSHNGRVSNNCNLSEDICGFSTRFGDSVGDFSPLSNLTTVEIVQIGEYLGLPYDLVHKVPMDGLNTNENDEYITDEDVMGVKYSDIHMYARTPDVLKESNPTVYEVIRQKEMKNAFKLKPMPAYRPLENLIFKD